MQDIEIVSPTFSAAKLEEILVKTRPLATNRHLLYPADNRKPSAHLPSFFYFEKVLSHPEALTLITEDLLGWIKSRNISVDLVFAPNEPSVRLAAEKLAGSLKKPAAFLEYLPTGRFGESIEGEHYLQAGKNVLVFNGVSTTGRCVGLRLPSFVQKNQARVSAISAFAKGTTQGVEQAEKDYPEHFYSAIQVHLPLYPAEPEKCPLCQKGIPLHLWNEYFPRRCAGDSPQRM